MEYDDLLKHSSYIYQIILRGKHKTTRAISLHKTKTMPTHESIFFPVLTITIDLTTKDSGRQRLVPKYNTSNFQEGKKMVLGRPTESCITTQ